MGMFSDWLRRDKPKGLEAARQRILEDEEMIARELPKVVARRIAGARAPRGDKAKEKLAKQGITASGSGDDVSVNHPPNWKGGDQLADAGIKTTQGARKKLSGPDNEDGSKFNPDTTPLKLNLRGDSPEQDSTVSRVPEAPTPRQPIALDGDAVERRAQALQYLRDNSQQNGLPGSNITGRGNKPHQVTSGIDHEDEYPYFTSPRLSALNDVIKQYVQRENSGHFYDEFPFVDPDNLPAPKGIETFDDDRWRGMPNTMESNEDVDRLLEIGSSEMSDFGRYGFAYPQEREALMRNFPDEASAAQDKLIEFARQHKDTVTDEMTDYFYDNLSSGERNLFNTSGHVHGNTGRWAGREEEWGRGLARIYLEQGGQDGYSRGEGSPRMGINDLTADHAVAFSENKDFWRDKAREQFPDLEGSSLDEEARALADDHSNIVLTRFGFNKFPKNVRSLWETRQKQETYADPRKGPRKEAQDAQKEIGKERSANRDSEYYDVMAEHFAELTKPIKTNKAARELSEKYGMELSRGDIVMQPEDFEELVENGRLGYDRLDASDPMPEIGTSGLPDRFVRNALTDPMRAMMQVISASNTGIGTFSEEYPRSSDGAGNAGWTGLTESHQSRGASTYRMNGGAYTDPQLDYLKLGMAKMALFGGPNSIPAAQAVFKRMTQAGRDFSTGFLGSGQMVDYLRDNYNMMRELSIQNNPDLDIDEYDQGAGDNHKKILNNIVHRITNNPAIADRLGGSKAQEMIDQLPDGITTDDLRIPPRPIKNAQLHSEARDREFESLHAELKSFFSEYPNLAYDEASDQRRGTILETYNQLELML